MSFKDKVILITRASSSVGAAIALRFASTGALLSLSDHNEDKLKKVVEDCQKVSGCELFFVVADVSNEADTKRILATTIARYGRIDVLVNNACVLEMETIDPDNYVIVANTSVRTAFNLTVLTVPHLVDTKGNMVYVCSVSGVRTFSGGLTNCITESSIGEFTKGSALELESNKVRVNCINSGTIFDNIHNPGLLEEIADKIQFLASDSAANMTGVTLVVDGSKHENMPKNGNEI